ncbi:MAG: hypothetical protein ACE14T_00535 [Syntrophales bacterium]
MDKNILLVQLEELAYKLGLKIREEHIAEDEVPVVGGLCRIKDENVIIINSKAAVKDRIRVLIDVFSRFDLNNIYIRPALREMLERQKNIRFE